jgi:hypothetical protein
MCFPLSIGSAITKGFFDLRGAIISDSLSYRDNPFRRQQSHSGKLGVSVPRKVFTGAWFSLRQGLLLHALNRKSI